jgi:glutamate/tyrosine decarboxylase-like PLP-dependent enzyme
MSSQSDDAAETSLDPADWTELRREGHKMLDDMIDYLEHVRERPVWQPIPDYARQRFQTAIPRSSTPLATVYREFKEFVAPYSSGNIHPGFMGWVQGGGTAVGMLAEMLAAGLNANLGGRDHMPIEVERQITRWMRELFGFPETASGLFVTGTSLANLIAVLVARTKALGPDIRSEGMASGGGKLRAYTSAAAHACIGQAMDLSGLGTGALRRIPTDVNYSIDVKALREAIAADRRAGLQPFLVVATVGTVDTGAIDDLEAISAVCREENLPFHIDGAYGALLAFSDKLKDRLSGIENAHSIAFDFHKWGQVPYDAGFILVRDGEQHREAFAAPTAYLRREARGLAGGEFWPCDYGPDLSRGFRALKTWFTLKTYGIEKLGKVVEHTCALARYLELRVRACPYLELMTPVQLNIVCFRYRTTQESDAINGDIVADLHASGVSAPSTTIIEGQLAIRAAIVNHRTRMQDIDALVDAVLRLGHGHCERKLRNATAATAERIGTPHVRAA